MNKKLSIRSFATLLAATGLSLSLGSCDEWTEPRPIDLDYTTVEDAPGYEAYLEQLRNYRLSDHKPVYVWFTAPDGAPLGQSQRLSALPDSIDAVVIEGARDLHPVVVEDMAYISEKKHIRLLYSISFDKIMADYAELVETGKGGTMTAADYLGATLDKELEVSHQDGFMFGFEGKSLHHLEADERAEQLLLQRTFFERIARLKTDHGVHCDFAGQPQNVADPEWLSSFDLLFLTQGIDAVNADMFSFFMAMGAVEGIPAERLAMMSACPSADPEDQTTGFFHDGSAALPGFASWLRRSNSAGAGIINVQSDYYNSTTTYSGVRAVIQALNPSAKAQ